MNIRRVGLYMCTENCAHVGSAQSEGVSLCTEQDAHRRGVRQDLQTNLFSNCKVASTWQQYTKHKIHIASN